MSDLSSQIREYFDATAPPVAFDDALTNDPGTRGWSRARGRAAIVPGWAYGLAVLVLLLTVTLGLSGLMGGTREVVVQPTSTTTPSFGVFDELAPGEIVDLPAAPLGGREAPAVAWTGAELIVWGGSSYEDSAPDGKQFLDDGAAFDPVTLSWRVIAPAPLSPREYPAAVWTGTELIVWGGHVAQDVRTYNGAAYDPSSDTWRLLPPPPVGMGGGTSLLSMVWTGDEALVVGGEAAVAFDPVANSWRRLADPPRPGYPAMFTGDSVIVMDGTDIMRYDLALDRWSVVDLGSSEALVGIPAADGLLRTFVNLPSELGAPVQVLDGTGTRIADLSAFPGDPSLFGDSVGATGLWVGDEAVFWIWTGEFPYETEQVWALDPGAGTWRQLDSVLLDTEPVVANDVLVAPYRAEGGGGGIGVRSRTVEDIYSWFAYRTAAPSG